MDVENLKLDLKKMIVSVANISHIAPEDISDEISIFGEGLCLDSIDLLEMVIVLEKEFNLKIRNDEKGRAILRNVNDLAKAIVQANGEALAH